METLYLNPDIFICFTASETVLWNYGQSEQFVIEKPFLDRIEEISRSSGPYELGPIDKELLAAGIVSLHPFKQVEWGWGLPARIFHLGSQNSCLNQAKTLQTEYTQKYIEACGERFDNPDYETHVTREGRRVGLPAPEIELFTKVSLWDSLKNRATCRNFKDESISLNALSTLLYAAFGEIHGEWNLESIGLRSLGIRKASPAGGAIHASQAYVCVFNVDGLEPGVYFYNSELHDLTVVREGNLKSGLVDLLFGQFFIANLPVGVFITNRMDRMWRKYPHSRFYRIPLLDIGHISQTFHLAATALGLQTWLSSAFNDTEVSKAIGLDNPCENPFLFLGVGRGTGDFLWPEVYDEIAKHEKRKNDFAI